MSPHLNAKARDYAKIVLMPGDPIRAKYLAKKLLSKTRIVNAVRGCYGFTGYFKNNKISFQASGMGQPSLSIYATELFAVYNVDLIIRIGTCGSFQKNINCGDIIIPKFSYTEENDKSSSLGDEKIKLKIINLFEKYNIKYHSGAFISNNNYYQDNPNWWKPLAKKGVLGVDMETYALYNKAKQFNKKALTVNLVSDNLINGDDIGQANRIYQTEYMTRIILEAVSG